MKKKFSLEETAEIARWCGEMTQLKTRMACTLSMYAGFRDTEEITFQGSGQEQAILFNYINQYKGLLVKFHQEVPAEIQERLVFLTTEQLVKFGERFVDFYHGKPLKKSEIMFYETF